MFTVLNDQDWLHLKFPQENHLKHFPCTTQANADIAYIRDMLESGISPLLWSRFPELNKLYPDLLHQLMNPQSDKVYPWDQVTELEYYWEESPLEQEQDQESEPEEDVDFIPVVHKKKERRYYEYEEDDLYSDYSDPELYTDDEFTEEDDDDYYYY